MFLLKGSYGVDYSHARPTAAQLAAVPARFACRYLIDDARDHGKGLKLPEAQRLSSWGIPIVANFEYATEPVLTSAQGKKDARTALTELGLLGATRMVVYFSFDYDVPTSHYQGVMAYLSGAATVLGKENVGIYGHYGIIETAWKAGFRWLWQCYAWSGGKWSAHATCRQIRNGAFPDWDGDLNIAMTNDIGQWSLEPEMQIDPFSMDADIAPTTGYTAGQVVEAERVLQVHFLRTVQTKNDVAKLATQVAELKQIVTDLASVVDDIAHRPSVPGVPGATSGSFTGTVEFMPPA